MASAAVPLEHFAPGGLGVATAATEWCPGLFEPLLLLLAGLIAVVEGPGGIWDAIVHDFSNITEPAAFAAFLQVLMIDLVLAGDNAIVVGALAAGLSADQRRKVIMIGVLAALGVRDRVDERPDARLRFFRLQFGHGGSRFTAGLKA